jgi:hypothetical protein
MNTATNYDRIGQALRLYADVMKGYVLGQLKKEYGTGKGWLEAYLGSFRSDERRGNVVKTLQNVSKPEEAFDINHVRDVLLGHRELFSRDFGRMYSSTVTYADEITQVRNAWAHQQEIDPYEAERALGSIFKVLDKIGAADAAKQVRELRENVLPKQQIAQELPAWWRLAEPHDDIRKGNFDENTFAAKLDDVVGEKAPPEYLHADEFYQKTYLTEELRGLLKDTLKRLAKTGGEAVVQLKTPFGGGKTHALIALYHLVKKAADVEDLPDIQTLLKEVNLEHVPHAKTVVLVGTDLNVQGRKTEDGLTLRTLWGELAYQLGGKAAYQKIEASDKARTSPGKETLRSLLEGQKALLLMDEILVYQVKAAGVEVGDTTLQAQTFAFLQELTEVVGGVQGVALITTFPESKIEYYDHEQSEPVFDRLEKIFGRVQAIRIPVQGEEILEVVRRRLFEKIDDTKAKQVIAQYQSLYTAHREDLPSEVRSSDFGRRMMRAYPFHPELISVLYERWGTLQTFQKTRGVLRLLARVIEYGYMSPAARPLISLGDVGLEDGNLRTTLTSILKDANWDAVIAADIAPGKAQQLDKEIGGEYARYRLSQAVTSGIFMYSHSGGGSERGVTEPRLRLALLQPEGITSVLVSDALSRMKDKLYYLYGNGGWSFKAQPNLNSVLAERTSQVKPEVALDKLKEALTSKIGTGLFKAFVWSTDSREVSDNTSLKVVLLSPSQSSDDKDENERTRFVIQQNASGSPRINKNTLLYLAGERRDFNKALDVAKLLLALEDVSSDKGLVLSADQKEDLRQRLQRTREQLPELAKAAYTLLYEPINNQGECRIHNLSATVKTQATLQSAVVETLKSEDRLLASIDPALLVSYEPYQLWMADQETLSLRNLRDYFDRYPHLPMLESTDVLKAAIIKGVQNGLFEAALKAEQGYTKVWRRTNPPSEGDLFFADHYLLTRPGVIPLPQEPTPAPNASATTGQVTAPTASVSSSVTATKPSSTSGSKTIRHVQLTFNNLPVSDVADLVSIVGALEDAGGTVTLNVLISAVNGNGLDKTMLELNVREVLSQLNLNPEWQEN